MSRPTLEELRARARQVEDEKRAEVRTGRPHPHAPNRKPSAPKKPPVERRPLTPDEASLVNRLKRCTLAPGSGEKAFIQTFAPSRGISERQADWLKKIAHRYRKQLEALP